MIQKLTEKMIGYFSGDPRRIQHFIKVHAFSRYIGLREQLPEHELFVLECAALVHDIGSRRKRSTASAEGSSRSAWDLPKQKRYLRGLGSLPGTSSESAA